MAARAQGERLQWASAWPPEPERPASALRMAARAQDVLRGSQGLTSMGPTNALAAIRSNDLSLRALCELPAGNRLAVQVWRFGQDR